jgi:hypothetical protein
MNDAEFMRIAIEESKNGDWPKGAVIVKDGAISNYLAHRGNHFPPGGT